MKTVRLFIKEIKMRPIRCILSFHKTELIRVFTERADELFGKPSLYAHLRVSKCERCKWYQFAFGKILGGMLFTGSYWQPELSKEDKEYIYSIHD